MQGSPNTDERKGLKRSGENGVYHDQDRKKQKVVGTPEGEVLAKPGLPTEGLRSTEANLTRQRVGLERAQLRKKKMQRTKTQKKKQKTVCLGAEKGARG